MLIINTFMNKFSKTYRTPYTGLFKPARPYKYKGNTNNIVYRSSWEKRFMTYCDKTPEVLEWGSEEISIVYRSIDNRPHRYYPDFYMKVKQPDGTTKKFVVEIKPKYQTRKPVKKIRETRAYKNQLVTYEKNRRKWNTAYACCLKRDMRFIILTEDHLKTF